LPPVVAAPAFAIRKPAVAVFTLDDYVAKEIMTSEQAEILKSAVAARKNILVAGGTSTGKTTLTNALLAEVAKTADRVVLIEDTRELQCTAPNLVALRTNDGVATLSDLVRSSLRLRPDRIPVGEVRGAEALDLLKAWGTGHPGGIGTIHAGTALGALRRLEQLIQEAVITVPRALIAETINVIAVLAGRGADRRLVELALVRGLELPATTAFQQQETDMRQQIRFLRGASVAAFGTVLLAAAPAWAAGSNMPWEQPLNQILQSVEGPVAKIIAVIIIVVTGLTLAFGDSSGGFRRLIQIVFGLSIAFAASSFFLSFFSFGGGVVV
jgi:type IV secretory pathway VirB2 component (pilin)